MIRIGYVVEGWRDRAFLSGLARRWCRGTELVEGHYRGSTGSSLRRELAKACRELLENGASFIVILRDANLEDWQEVRTRENERVPAKVKHCTIYGVAERNIEDWLNADPGYLSEQLGSPLPELSSAGGPKKVLDREIGGRCSAQAEARIAAIVEQAPLDRWIQASRSFGALYDDARSMAQRSGACQIPNERGQ